MQKPKILIVGRTQTGKTTLAKALADAGGLSVLRTHTNRPKRSPDETGYVFHALGEEILFPDPEKILITRAQDGYWRWTTMDDLLGADIAILDPCGAAGAVEIWKTYGFPVILVYCRAKKDTRKKAALDAGIDPKAHEVRERNEEKPFDDLERFLEIRPLSPWPVSAFGEDSDVVWENHYDDESLDLGRQTIGHTLGHIRSWDEGLLGKEAKACERLMDALYHLSQRHGTLPSSILANACDAASLGREPKSAGMDALLGIHRAGALPGLSVLAEISKKYAVPVSDLVGKENLQGAPKKIYLAGPITGTEGHEGRFETYVRTLERSGEFAVFNPAEASSRLPVPWMETADFYRIGLAILECCDAIALMPGWKNSAGCRMEKAWAEAHGLEIIEL